MIFVRTQSGRRLIIVPGRLRPREEIHLDLADTAAAELNIASAETVIFYRLAHIPCEQFLRKCDRLQPPRAAPRR
jgi:hypothetical protein